MIRINQIKLPHTHKKDALYDKAASLLNIDKADISALKIVKKSIDARKKPDIYIIYTIDIETENEDALLRRLNGHLNSRQNGAMSITKAEDVRYSFKITGDRRLQNRPVIIGTGPAGLFCGYFLARNGYRPILLERGKSVDERLEDVNKFWERRVLNEESNVQFGEGGAGTFSDGKLNTLIKDKSGKNKEVLKIFVSLGAPEEILYEAKPHIGTDILVKVVKNMRREIIANGGEARFESKVTDIVADGGKLKALVINDNEKIDTDVAVLAIGHSARDTFRMLHRHGVPMDTKSFAVGLRVEHPREMINKLQYGFKNSEILPTASYKLTARTKDGRGVYSFCMCPGGYVVNASSWEGGLAVNGMSYSARKGDNSNSAVIVTVTPEDFGASHPLSGVEFQERLEKKACLAGRGKVPVETYGDFKAAVTGAEAEESYIIKEYPEFKPQIKGGYEFSSVHEILPDNLNRAFVEGMEQFGKIMKGFNDSGVYVSGVESRTSSPVRIHRDDAGRSALYGLYPCGEGAGYAGGITSAAMDGITTAEKIAAEYKPFYQ